MSATLNNLKAKRPKFQIPKKLKCKLLFFSLFSFLHLSFSGCSVWFLLRRTDLLDAEQTPQVDLRVHVVRDLAFVEEARQVGLHFGSSGDAHAQREQVVQVLLHQGKVVAVQTLLPRLPRPLAILVRTQK